MRFMLLISDMMIPMLFVSIILYGYYKSIDIYDIFIEGVKDGFQTVLKIAPTLIGLMISVGILRASGALDFLSSIASPVTNVIGIPKETVPLIFMRLVSSSASTGLLLDLFKNFGADSFTGRFVSIMMSCTETVFYTMSVYFMSVKITKTRYTLAAALFANFVGVIVSLYITKFMFP